MSGMRAMNKPGNGHLGVFELRLYVVGTALNSIQAIANLSALCQEHLPDQHVIEVVDVLLEPQRALADKVFMTPTLLKLGPTPTRKIFGNLSKTQLVLQALELAAHDA